jgi:hypothetical protein
LRKSWDKGAAITASLLNRHPRIRTSDSAQPESALVKLYGPAITALGRYSPAECTGIKKIKREGNPDIAHVSTSYVERQNLTMPMSMRRFTRVTNGFSKKLDNHVHALALYFAFYNFCRIHKTLRTSPAMGRWCK